MRITILALFSGMLLIPAAFAGQPQDEGIAVKAGRIITVSGDEIEDGVILIREGKIVEVGKDVKVPALAKVIDASDRVVFPGYIEPHSSQGVDRQNERMPSVPFVSVFDSINPVDPYFEDSLRQGITTIFVIPGNSTMIGGHGVVVRPTGITVERMTVAKDIALKISLLPSRGQSRMAHLAALRREFDAILRYMKELEEKRETPTGTKEGGAEPEIAIKKEAMVRLLKQEIPAFVYCPEASDVLKAYELADQYKFKMQLVVGADAWKALDVIKRRKGTVILDPTLVYWETDEETHEEVLRVPPVEFHKAGVKMVFQSDSGSLGSAYLWYQAATAVKYGVPRAEALKAVTLNAAEVVGLGDRLGSIEKGKDANLVILTGDPLDALTWVDQVMIEGRIVYDRSKDDKLERILGGGKKKEKK